MIKYYCDKCKKETEGKRTFLMQIKGVTTENRITKHLCNSCYNLFNEFLRQESSNGSEEGDIVESDPTVGTALPSIKPMERVTERPAEPMDSKNWKPTPEVARRLQSLYSNSLLEDEYSALVGKSKISVALKCAIVNLYINGESIADIAHDLGTEYVTAYQTCNAFRGKLRPVEPSTQELININNLLRAGWKIRDISEDQDIDILKVANAYMRRYEEAK